MRARSLPLLAVLCAFLALLMPDVAAAQARPNHIAARLVITEDTAKSHVKRILRKLGAANRVEAATIWLKAQQS